MAYSLVRGGDEVPGYVAMWLVQDAGGGAHAALYQDSLISTHVPSCANRPT